MLGLGTNGQLGDGLTGTTSTPHKRTAPVKVLNPIGTSGELKNISQISLGGNHACALRNEGGRVLCWGLGADGQLGVGSTDNSSRPVMVVQSSTPLTNVTQLSGGNDHTCALKNSSGQVYCWGKGASKQLGQIDNIDNKKTPQRVRATTNPNLSSYLSDVEQVGVGYGHSCALKTGGNLVCWGERGSGQLGDGKRDVAEDRGVPAPVASESDRPDIPLQTISAGGLHSCQINNGIINGTEGSIQCWGRGFGGQLGSNEQITSNKAQIVSESDSSGTGDLLDMAQVSSGENHSCALNSSGQVYCWGLGFLGDGEDVRISQRPVLVPQGLVETDVDEDFIPVIAQISVGTEHTCAVTVGGKVLCWGEGYAGRLGNGSGGDKLRPEYVLKKSDSERLSNIVQVSAGGFHTCAVNKNNAVFCWGSNYNGQLGAGANSVGETKAHQIHTSNITATQVSAGNEHTCALRPNSKVACWGNGSKGQFGRGSSNTSSTGIPTDVSNLENVVQISAKDNHTCAVNTDSKVLCWGDNEYGQVGRSNSTIWVPRFVYGNNGTGNLTDIIEVSAGWNHTCARKADGTSACWGRGTDGQLGAHNYESTVNPINVSLTNGTPKKFTIKRRVSAGYKHTCAVKTSDQGKVYCWGDASDGRLGINSSSGDKKRGLLVKGVGNSGNLTNIAQVTAGGKHTCALAKDNKVFCWGKGGNGRLGQTSNSNSLVPVEINYGFTVLPYKSLLEQLTPVS